jgi:parallel beta-helix repeat protein
VIVGGTRLTPARTAPPRCSLNTFRYVAGSGLYVNVAGANPGASTTYVGRRASAFVVAGRSWITIEGFTSLRADDRAFNLTSGAADLDIVGNTVRYSAKYGMYLSDCHRVRVASNTLSDNGHHGLMLTNATSNCTIEDNEACRNAAPDVRVANGLHLYSATANVIRRNRWHDNQDSGEHLQSGSNDNISSNNISWNNGDHGFDHLGATGTLHLNDVAYGNVKDGFAIEGVSTGTRLVNCIATENGLGTNEFDLWVDTGVADRFQLDDNLLWNSTSQKPVKFGGHFVRAGLRRTPPRPVRTRDRCRRIRGSSPPRTATSACDANSPAIDNGNSSDPNWPATDQQGRAARGSRRRGEYGPGPVPWSDRGALEYQPGGVPPVAALSASPAMSLAPAVVTLDASGSSDANGTVVSYRFEFGDGTSAGPQPGA